MTRNKMGAAKIGAATLLAGVALTTAAWAQFGGGVQIGMPPPVGGPPPPGSGMPMGGGPPPGRPGGNPFGGRMPFTAGKIRTVNAAAGTVTLTPMFGGAAAQTVQTTGTTQITAQTDVKVGELKVGDTVQVHGVPTGILATQITAGDSFDAPMGSPLGGPRPGGMAGGPRPGGPSADFAQASGKITALTPLTISLSDSVQVTLKVTATTIIHKNVTEKIGDLKVGDRIMANGLSGDDGVFHATRLRVNGDYGLGRR